MTVFVRYGQAVKDPASINAPLAVNAEAMSRLAYSNIAVNNDGIGSTHVLARVPSNARLSPGSAIYFSALTGLTSYSVGLGVNGAIVNSKTAALVSALDIHSAGNGLLSTAIGAGHLGDLLWQLAGFTSDPGGMIDIIGTVNAAATTTGTIESYVHFHKG